MQYSCMSIQITSKKKNLTLRSMRFRCQRRPIFPGSFPPSIFGTEELNYRVRNGNGWTLFVIDTDYEL